MRQVLFSVFLVSLQVYLRWRALVLKSYEYVIYIVKKGLEENTDLSAFPYLSPKKSRHGPGGRPP